MNRMQTVYDVIIIGAGPAGLLCALWLTLQGVSVGIFEKQSERPARGRADGFEPRTLEILNSFGLLDSWWRGANRTVELSVWVSRQKEQIERILRRCNSAQGTSDFYDVTMDQAVLERAMEQQLIDGHGVAVQYGSEPLDLTIKEFQTADEWPVCLKVKQDGHINLVSAKYAIGADGAHSWTRTQVGIEMETSRTAQYWGVADIHPLTNFHIRCRCIIHKEGSGTLMLIPREDGMVRIYVQLDDAEMDKSSITSGRGIVAVAQKIIAPFELEFQHCYRGSRYQVQQGIATHFSAFQERVFLIGDAIHTHSPKAGMGLNVSLQDAYNLGWKLAAVIRKMASPRLLATYEEERRPVAEFLVNFDREFLNIFHDPLNGITIEEYRNAVIAATTKEHAELSGVSICYDKGTMFQSNQHDQHHLASRIRVGRRMPSAVVVNHADGRSRTMHDLLPSNGHWRLVIFPGDLRDRKAMHRYIKLSEDLEKYFLSRASLLALCEGKLDIITVHRSPRHQIDFLDLPAVYHPWSDKFGWNYNRIFSDEETLNDPSNTGCAYKQYGISSDGCVLLLRPDQHVGVISKVDGAVEVCAQFLRRLSVKREHTLVSKRIEPLRAVL